MEWWSTMEMVTGTVGMDMAAGTVGVDIVAGTVGVDIAAGTVDVDMAVGMVDVDMVTGMVGVDLAAWMVGVDLAAGAEVAEEDRVIVAVEEIMVVDICNNSQVVTMTMVVEHLLGKEVVRFLIMLL